MNCSFMYFMVSDLFRLGVKNKVNFIINMWRNFSFFKVNNSEIIKKSDSTIQKYKSCYFKNLLFS